MIRCRFTLMTVLLTTTVLSAQAAPNGSAPTPPAPSVAAEGAAPPIPSKVTTVEGITEFRLPNGLRVLLFPDPTKPTVLVNVTYLVGSRVEGYG